MRARYVLVSCDWVFSGLRPPGERWEETDAVEPVNAYGRALAAAEGLVREAEVDWLIVRTGDPYGVNLSRPIERRDVRGHGGHGGRGHRERRGEPAGVRRQGALGRARVGALGRGRAHPRAAARGAAAAARARGRAPLADVRVGLRAAAV